MCLADDQVLSVHATVPARIQCGNVLEHDVIILLFHQKSNSFMEKAAVYRFPMNRRIAALRQSSTEGMQIIAALIKLKGIAPNKI